MVLILRGGLVRDERRHGVSLTMTCGTCNTLADDLDDRDSHGSFRISHAYSGGILTQQHPAPALVGSKNVSTLMPTVPLISPLDTPHLRSPLTLLY